MTVRNPTIDRNPLDRASFYVEDLKYGPGPGLIEAVTRDQITSQLEVLLREGRVESMTGAELAEAARFYGDSLAESFRCSPVLAHSCFMDGLMHGIALAGGLEGEPRFPKEANR